MGQLWTEEARVRGDSDHFTASFLTLVHDNKAVLRTYLSAAAGYDTYELAEIEPSSRDDIHLAIRGGLRVALHLAAVRGYKEVRNVTRMARRRTTQHVQALHQHRHGDYKWSIPARSRQAVADNLVPKPPILCRKPSLSFQLGTL
jgi:hypothetical protein